MISVKPDRHMKITYRGNTCMMVQIAQQQLFPKRISEPSNQVSPLEPLEDFVATIPALSSFGPLSNAMDMAPPTLITVPIIFALLLKLRILTFSILLN